MPPPGPWFRHHEVQINSSLGSAFFDSPDDYCARSSACHLHVSHHQMGPSRPHAMDPSIDELMLILFGCPLLHVYSFLLLGHTYHDITQSLPFIR